MKKSKEDISDSRQSMQKYIFGLAIKTGNSENSSKQPVR